MRAISAIGSSPGFSLLELLVVLAILVMASVAWPLASPRFFPKQQLRSTAMTIVQALRSSRTIAISSNRTTTIKMSPSATQINDSLRTYLLPTGIQARLTTLGKPTPKESIQFYSDGTSDGGYLQFLSQSGMAQIRVSPVTGRVELLP